MLVSLMLLAAMAGLVPDRNAAVRDGRARLAEAIAVNSSIFITTSDIRRMKAILQTTVERNDDILSAAVTRTDGQALAVIGDHARYWHTSDQNDSTDSQVVVPIYEGSDEWGRVELAFKPMLPDAWYGQFLNPVFLLLGFMSFTSFIVFYFYLGKMLKQLDPSQAIPERVRSALDTMAEGLLVIDARLNVVLANQAFSTLVNEPAESLIGRQIGRFSWLNRNDESIDPAQFPWTRTLADGLARTADMIRLKVEDGSSRTFMTNCSPVLSGNGKAAGVLISFDDVTELEQKELELRISKEEAEQANRFKSEFLANMSHEIRTPMNAILGFAEVLKRGYDKNSGDSIRYLNTISSSGNHLLSLINDILDLSKVEAGRLEIEKVHTPVHQIVQDVVQIMKVKADEKHIDLTFEPSGPLPEFIETDSAKIRQIITNLVGNAIKFTESGGVRIVTTLHENTDGAEVVIDVVDTGIGMSPQQAKDVFNPFTQADSSITRRFGGTGLGLTISKRFAEALGGDIDVESKPGAGSRFSLRVDAGSIAGIRLLDVDEILSTQWHATATQTTRWKFPPCCVLVVDDGAENRELINVVLGDADIEVVTAENGQLALDLAANRDFNVVLMDVQMPVMDGFTAVGLMRERGMTQPIIALTADAMTGAQQKCLDAGYSDYMSKPIDIDELVNRLAGLLGGKQIIEAGTTTSKRDENPVVEHEQTGQASICSSLPMSNPKFRGIVERFVTRLEQQLESIDRAWRERDYVELKRLGHWLKGSAGSVGLGAFVEPAAEFERFAVEKNDPNIEVAIQRLHSLFSRVEIEQEKQSAPGTVEAREYKEYNIPEKLTCRLLDTNPRLRPILDRFVSQLADWFDQIDEAVMKNDFDKIGKFAYWLKGAGGSIGFDAFTEPAKDLEVCAKQKQQDVINYTIKIIKDINHRIVIGEV
jgi:PAS domain S-box-containing protein